LFGTAYDALAKYSWVKKCKVFSSAHLRSHAYCLRHHQACPLVRADIEICGSPCQDFSQSGLRRGCDGPTMSVLLAWILRVRTLCPTLLVHENVPSFPVHVLVHFLGDRYYICPLLIDGEMHAAAHVSRNRRYTLMVRKDCRVLADPACMLHTIQHCLMQVPRVRVADCFIASFDDLVSEIFDLCANCGIPFDSVMDMTHRRVRSWITLLTPTEHQRLIGYEALWFQRVGTHPSEDPNCVFNLGDSPWGRPTMSVESLAAPSHTHTHLHQLYPGPIVEGMCV
jgi:hypothetical protein